MFGKHLIICKSLIVFTMVLKIGYTIEKGSIHKRVYGGMLAEIGEFPWQVGIWIKNMDTQQFYFECGGTIIKNTWVVTAAHCIINVFPENYLLQIGKTNLNHEESNERIIEISKLIMHEEFSYLTLEHDIALMKLKDALHYTNDVRPILLPKPDAKFDYMVCTASGWGINESHSNIQEIYLKKVNLKVEPKCIDALHATLELDKVICAWTTIKEGESICEGDTGGPLQCLVNGRYFIAGITSGQIDYCGTPASPDIFTRTSYYYDWIIDTISNED